MAPATKELSERLKTQAGTARDTVRRMLIRDARGERVSLPELEKALAAAGISTLEVL